VAVEQSAERLPSAKRIQRFDKSTLGRTGRKNRGSRERGPPVAEARPGPMMGSCGRGGARNNQDREKQPQPAHQSICRLMKVGISMSGTSAAAGGGVGLGVTGGALG